MIKPDLHGLITLNLLHNPPLLLHFLGGHRNNRRLPVLRLGMMAGHLNQR